MKNRPRPASAKASTREKNMMDKSRNESRSEEVKSSGQSPFASTREIVESLVFALFLAFLIKAFEVEAFVIPTGSMAPTLRGRHKDLLCEKCHFPFQVNASEEMDNDTNRRRSVNIIAGTCPQCRYTQYFRNDPQSFTGDRILVSKSAFETRPLRRWDVSVFRAPPDPKTNFIKRIVGLPNERLKMEFGDLFVQKKKPSGEYTEYEIVRKPLVYLRQMLQMVHDNDYPLVAAESLGWPSRWVDELTTMNQGIAGWVPINEGRSFSFSGKTVQSSQASGEKAIECQTPVLKKEFDGATATVQWMRYRHIVPASSHWQTLAKDQIPPDVMQTRIVRNNPQLITDFNTYNTGMSRTSELGHGGDSEYSSVPIRHPDSFGYNWSGDLAVSCDLTFSDHTFTEESEIIFELVKGGQAFRCHVRPFDGRITLEIPGISSYLPETAIHRFKARKYNFQFMNIDEQLRLVIDDQEVVFPNEGKYDHLCQPLPDGRPGVLPRDRDPDLRDLMPVSIGARAVNVRADHIRIQRDLYYIAMGNHVGSVTGSEPGTMFNTNNEKCDRLCSRPYPMTTEEEVTTFFATPQCWKGVGKTLSATFMLEQNQYLAMGDNSSNSQDSRLWGRDGAPYFVDRKYLIGKAFYVFWPHGIPFPGTRLPVVPNVGKMRHID